MPPRGSGVSARAAGSALDPAKFARPDVALTDALVEKDAAQMQQHYGTYPHRNAACSSVPPGLRTSFTVQYKANPSGGYLRLAPPDRDDLLAALANCSEDSPAAAATAAAAAALSVSAAVAAVAAMVPCPAVKAAATAAAAAAAVTAKPLRPEVLAEDVWPAVFAGAKGARSGRRKLQLQLNAELHVTRQEGRLEGLKSLMRSWAVRQGEVLTLTLRPDGRLVVSRPPARSGPVGCGGAAAAGAAVAAPPAPEAPQTYLCRRCGPILQLPYAAVAWHFADLVEAAWRGPQPVDDLWAAAAAGASMEARGAAGGAPPPPPVGHDPLFAPAPPELVELRGVSLCRPKWGGRNLVLEGLRDLMRSWGVAEGGMVQLRAAGRGEGAGAGARRLVLAPLRYKPHAAAVGGQGAGSQGRITGAAEWDTAAAASGVAAAAAAALERAAGGGAAAAKLGEEGTAIGAAAAADSDGDAAGCSKWSAGFGTVDGNGGTAAAAAFSDANLSGCCHSAATSQPCLETAAQAHATSGQPVSPKAAQPPAAAACGTGGGYGHGHQKSPVGGASGAATLATSLPALAEAHLLLSLGEPPPPPPAVVMTAEQPLPVGGQSVPAPLLETGKTAPVLADYAVTLGPALLSAAGMPLVAAQPHLVSGAQPLPGSGLGAQRRACPARTSRRRPRGGGAKWRRGGEQSDEDEDFDEAEEEEGWAPDGSCTGAGGDSGAFAAVGRSRSGRPIKRIRIGPGKARMLVTPEEQPMGVMGKHLPGNYRWRKYGEKMIKGTCRAYLRCAHAGCGVLAKAEWAQRHSSGGGANGDGGDGLAARGSGGDADADAAVPAPASVPVLRVWYDGEHNHPPPPLRGRVDPAVEWRVEEYWPAPPPQQQQQEQQQEPGQEQQPQPQQQQVMISMGGEGVGVMDGGSGDAAAAGDAGSSTLDENLAVYTYGNLELDNVLDPDQDPDWHADGRCWEPGFDDYSFYAQGGQLGNSSMGGGAARWRAGVYNLLDCLDEQLDDVEQLVQPGLPSGGPPDASGRLMAEPSEDDVVTGLGAGGGDGAGGGAAACPVWVAEEGTAAAYAAAAIWEDGTPPVSLGLPLGGLLHCPDDTDVDAIVAAVARCGNFDLGCVAFDAWLRPAAEAAGGAVEAVDEGCGAGDQRAITCE
ncbi:hypothetical protein PLESTF_000807100 [Pleodorina starrii]|nr:hypothetical protein PLESTM_001080700 [Pleodorina starrii]GLC69251.1 hypothetical protein PLESTF_000807100 [Pleodorina starrii]